MRFSERDWIFYKTVYFKMEFISSKMRYSYLVVYCHVLQESHVVVLNENRKFHRIEFFI